MTERSIDIALSTRHSNWFLLRGNGSERIICYFW